MNWEANTIYGCIAQNSDCVRATAILAFARPALSYQQLQQQIIKVGQFLRQQGIGRQDRVALVLPNGPEMAVAFLAVASVATSAPLNPAYTASEFAFYLKDLQAKALIVLPDNGSPAIAVACTHNIPVIELCPLSAAAGAFQLRSAESSATDHQDAQPLDLAQPTDVALLLHTSGTTARPKLVPLTHANLCASAANIQQALQLTADDRCLNIMPLFHIHGLVAALLASLYAGGSVVCTPGFAAAHFFEWLITFQPTWYTAVPTIHQAILAQAGQQPAHKRAHHLRLIRSSSAALPPTVLAALEAELGTPVIEAYGMTEAAHQIASNPLPPRARKAGAVGLAAGPQVAIMAEATDNFLPPGTSGEVVIAGANVTTGYLENHTANAEAFVGAWFRTGDQGYLDEEGYLFLRGRLKEIINRGGEKVAPREVDEALLAHPAVAQALTFALPHPQLGETVAAAVVLHPGREVTPAALRDFVAPHLTYFKIPSLIFFLETIPPGPTGKLQRIGFAERLGLSLPVINISPRPYVAPNTPLEEILVELWREVLYVEQIGIHDNFLALGGDSLGATQLAAQIFQHFQVELPLHRLLDTPTIAEQALTILHDLLEQQTPAQAAALMAEAHEAEPANVLILSTDVPQHWSNVAQVYHQTQSPLHPCAEDIAVMERFVARGVAVVEPPGGLAKPQALLLGVTPAIATMTWPQNTNLRAVDSSEGMLQTVWPGDRSGVRQAHLGDWLALPVEDATQTIVIGDGSLNCLEFPTGCQQLVNAVARVLCDGGSFVLRVYVQPPSKPSPARLFQELVDGRFHTFDSFKFLLNIALTDAQFNVAVQTVWQQWAQAQIDEAALCRVTGWSAASFSTIAYYQNATARYAFPTLAAVQSLLKARFDCIDLVTPSYPLGEYCPILHLRKRS